MSATGSGSRGRASKLVVVVAWLMALAVIAAGQGFRLYMEGRAARLSFPLHPDDYRQGPAVLQYAAIIGTWVSKNPFEVDRASFSAGLSGFALRAAIAALVFAGLVTFCVRSATVKRHLHEYFTTAGSALDLAMFRIVFFGFMLFSVTETTIHAASLPLDLMVPLKDPLPLWRLIHPSPTLMLVSAWLLRLGCVAAIVGFRPRLAAALVGLAYFYCDGVGQLFGKVNHSHHLVWTCAVLAAAPLGDALSIERWLSRRAPGAAVTVPAPSIAYSRPLRMIWLIMGVVYFYPGFWKALTGGSAWIFTENLQNRMFQKWSDDPSFVPLFRVDHFPLLLAGGAFGTLVFEMGWLFFVIPRKTRWISIAMGLGFHNMTRLTMNIAFWPLQVMYASFVPWQRLLDRFSSRTGPRSRPTPLAPPLESRYVRATTGIGSVVLGFILLYGAAHLDTAWPFACYPTFDAYLGDRVHDLGAYYVGRDGREQAVSEQRLTDALGAPRLRTLRRTIVYERNPERRDKALAAFVAGAGAGGGDAVAIRLYDEMRSLVPEIRPGGAVSRRLIGSVELTGKP